MVPHDDMSEYGEHLLAAAEIILQTLDSGLSVIDDEWRRIRNEVVALIDWVERELRDRNIVEDAMEWLVGDLGEAVQKARVLVAELDSRVVDFLRIVRETVITASPVLSLFETSFGYISVMSSLSGLSTRMNSELDLIHWKGDAKSAYERVLGEQKAAMSAVVDKARVTGTWLVAVAAENIAYMAELGGRVAMVVGKIVEVVIDGGFTASGALTQVIPMLQHLSEAIGEAVTQGMQYLFNLGARVGKVLTQVVGLLAESKNFTALQTRDGNDAHWPQSVAG